MGQKESIEIVVPIYNEEKELEVNITRLHSFLSRNFHEFKWQITIADNASSDQSPQIAKKLSVRNSGIKYFHLNQKGRGRAVKKAWADSSADFLVYMDVDLSTDLKYLKPLVAPLQNGFDISIGNRLIKNSIVKNRPLKREILSRGYNILIKLLFQVKFSDAQCGFKAVTKRVKNILIPHIQDNAWFFDSEMLIVGEKAGFRIFQLPVAWIDNPGSTVRVLRTVYGDLSGLWRLLWSRSWSRLND